MMPRVEQFFTKLPESTLFSPTQPCSRVGRSAQGTVCGTLNGTAVHLYYKHFNLNHIPIFGTSRSVVPMVPSFGM